MEHKSTQSRQLKLIVGKDDNFNPTIQFKAKMSQVEITIKMGQHIYISLRTSVSQVGEHISIRDMCFPGGGTHITRDLCFPGGEHTLLRICISH